MQCEDESLNDIVQMSEGQLKTTAYWSVCMCANSYLALGELSSYSLLLLLVFLGSNSLFHYLNEKKKIKSFKVNAFLLL